MEIGLLIAIIAIVILLALSAFFSGSETALTAASKVHLSALERDGNKAAARVNKVREKKDRMIGALLLGNNLVNILASALATSVLIKVFGEAGIVYATLVMTMLVLIFSEVLPKTYALHHADTMAMRVSPIIRMVIYIFAPITEAVTWIVRVVLRIFGVDISRVQAGSHMELLKGVIEMHEGPEQEIKDQRAMLRSILDMAEVDVEEIMSHRKAVEMIDIDDSNEDVVNQVLESTYTRLPIYKDDQDNIIGIIHAKALLRALRGVDNDPEKLDIHQICMEPWFIPETTNLYEQLQAFRERREHFALVVDEYGSFMGVVTLEDILEEIVGEIDDEHDVSMRGVRKLPSGEYLVDGTVTIRDLNREFHWRLPDEDYATIAGLILHEAQRIPQSGQSFQFYGFRFDILRRQRNQIKAIRIIPPVVSDESAE